MRSACIPWAALCLALSAAGCGSDGNDDGETMNSVGQYGGDCEDGDSRCTDAYGATLCPVRSGYDGDELAICEPAGVEEGLLLHYGPRDYNDEAEVAKYLLAANGEDENCVFVRTTNTEPIYVNRYHGRMRPNSHHLIVTIVAEPSADLVMNEPVPCDQTEAVGARWLLGSQDPQIDMEVEGNAPGSLAAQPGDPEYGLGQVIQPNTVLRIDMHYVNTTQNELLREGWVFLKAVPAEQVVTRVDMLTFFQGLISVPPNSSGTQTAIARCQVPSDRNIGMVTGHFHQNGTRFTVWHEKAEGGEPTMIYNTYDWDVPGNAFYTPRVQNPPMDGSNIWGATSGYMQVKAGDFISFQCEYDNPTNETITLGELGADQMCNVFGMYYPSNGDVWTCRCAGTVCF